MVVATSFLSHNHAIANYTSYSYLVQYLDYIQRYKHRVIDTVFTSISVGLSLPTLRGYSA